MAVGAADVHVENWLKSQATKLANGDGCSFG